MNIKVTFNIKLNKSIYEPFGTIEEFFHQFVVKYIADDYEFIKKMAEQQDIEDKYIPYINNLKTLNQDICDSITYELIESSSFIENFQIKFNFNYYENTISSAENMIETNVFYKIIKSNYFLATDLKRFYSDKESNERLDLLMAMYEHLGDSLTEAQKTLTISNTHQPSL